MACASREISEKEPALLSKVVTSSGPIKENGNSRVVYSSQSDQPHLEAPKDRSTQGKTSTGLQWLQNRRVSQWVDYFAKKDTSRFQRYLDRAEPYRDMVLEILNEYNVPPEIFYIGVIESGYRTDARSHASAVGVWQFIKDTGKRYGLRVDPYVDERRDPLRSTEAAAKYFRDLYNIFNSWELALSAYNAGEGRIMRAVMRGKSRDFWVLADKGVLPEETINYVPKFIAAAVIGENAERFGFEWSKSENLPSLRGVEVGHSTKLSNLAREAGVPVQVLAEANPHLLRGVTPPHLKTYRVWVPDIHVEAIKQAAARAPQTPLTHSWARLDEQQRINKKISNQKSNRTSNRSAGETPKTLRSSGPGRMAKRVGQKKYKVRPGDNLHSIADRFGVSVETLKRENKIKGSRIFAGDLLRITGT